MCGIAGHWGQFPADLLPRMNLAIAHRGPDADGLYRALGEHLGLAHRRLSIVDLSPTGAQPMHSADGRYVLVFNGEIYDFGELRRELETLGHVFRGHSDTEVLLNAWAQWGEASLARLNGIFAFAIWDNREQTLCVVRDPLGIKPLYFAQDQRGFLFASELKAILQDEHLDRSIDHEAVRDYLLYHYAPWPRTILKSVRKLEPGGALLLRGGRIERHWRYATLPAKQPDERLSAESAAEQLREQLRAAVERQLVADVPVGAFLSGGLDSSAVVAMAGERRLDCYTIAGGASARDGFADDLPYARQVAKHLNQPLHEIPITADLFDELPRMLWHLDEPEPDPAAINVLLICQGARAQGIKVLVGGTGGDDLLSGYRRHRALMAERNWAWLPRPARRALTGVTRHLPQGTPLTRRLSKAFTNAGKTPTERMLGYFQWVDEAVVVSLFEPAHTHGWAEQPFASSLRTTWETLPRELLPLQQMLLLEQSHFLTDHNLNYTDKLSMAVGVEVRVPLLDREFVEFAATLPVALKQRGAEGKWIFKKAMEGVLPHDVIYRPKTGFGAPLRSWLRGPQRAKIEELLTPEVLHKRGIFQPAAVQSLLERDKAGKLDGAYVILGLACFELWCRMFIDPPRATALA